MRCRCPSHEVPRKPCHVNFDKTARLPSNVFPSCTRDQIFQTMLNSYETIECKWLIVTSTNIARRHLTFCVGLTSDQMETTNGFQHHCHPLGLYQTKGCRLPLIESCFVYVKENQSMGIKNCGKYTRQSMLFGFLPGSDFDHMQFWSTLRML